MTKTPAEIMDKTYTSSMLETYNSIDLRLSHPNLYRSIMTFAIISVGLGLNFILTRPTFNPYHIPKEIIGSVFLTLGLLKIVFLNFRRNLILVRKTMSVEVGFMVFWGLGTSITYFQGKTSLQLFVLYVGLASFEIFLLIEPFANPLTGRNGNHSVE